MNNGLPFKIMEIVDNGPGSNVFTGPARVIDVQLNRADPLIWLIDRDKPHKKLPTQRKGYICSPFCIPLPEFVEHIRAGKLVVLNIQPTLALLLRDSDRLENCKTEKLRVKMLKQLQDRDMRFESIRPLVCVPGGNMPRPISEVVLDPKFAQIITAHAKSLGRSPSTLRSWMNRFWAGACQRNALVANFDGRCGTPGREKKQAKKLGRSPRLYKTGHWDSRGYSLTEEDKQRLSCGFALITKERTARDAYLLTCSAHWAFHVETQPGEIRATLFTKDRRPTFDQFMRWGAKLQEKTVRRIVIGRSKWEQERKTTGASERDTVVAVGQQAQFDGTSNDVYLVSFRSRLKKLPPLTRLILKESRTGIIYGIYCGWEPASPQTALQAILNGAIEDKRPWARRFDVEIDEDAIPGLLSRQILADNGELKGERPTEFETQFGVAISYAPSGRGDAKGSIESDHQRIHAHLDHRLPGTTHGKPRARGQSHPAADALWNYNEYMRELIRWIVWHNTVEEVPDIAPDDLLLLEPSIKPTRINIYKWLTRKGLNVSLNVDYDALRAFTLPDVEAVICKNGIRLIAEVHGRKTRLLRLRYTSHDLAQSGLLTQVKLTGKDIRTRVKMDPTDLSQVWLPLRGGLIKATHSTRDQLINKHLVLDEWRLYCEDHAVQKDLSAQDREQHRSDTVLRTHAVTNSAKAEVKGAISAMAKKPSRAALVANLENNRREEIELLRAQDRHLNNNEREEIICDSDDLLTDPPDAAENAMSAFLEDFE